MTADFDVEFANATKVSKESLLEASLYVFMQFAFCGSAVVIFATVPFMGEKRVLVYPSWYPINTENVIGYAAVYCIQMGGGVILCAVYAVSI